LTEIWPDFDHSSTRHGCRRKRRKVQLAAAREHTAKALQTSETPEPKPRLDEDLNVVTALQPKPPLPSSCRAREPLTEKRRGAKSEEGEGELSGIVHRREGDG
jgi:hypothetical protein